MKKWKVKILFSNHIEETVIIDSVTSINLLGKARTKAGLDGITGEPIRFTVDLLTPTGEGK